MTKRPIELLAPARNKEIGMAAITYGADAVYIGAARFGARAAAGNSIEDIEELCRFAHQYAARVYVTVNTIVFDEELPDTYRLIDRLSAIGVDAILLQDMGLIEYARDKIEIHASTQTDNRSAEKVLWLSQQGFSRVVLARELSVKEIAEIHQNAPHVELEAFVHGALCVSYSGQCYASEHCFNRSANRGECAQMCRMEYDLLNADGQTIIERQHLLSLKDMCRIDDLQQLVDAGVTSLKIEGRLKDIGYVKNVVSAYHRQIERIIKSHPDKYYRQSLGRPVSDFTPALSKSFNRGFTNYFLHQRQQNIIQPFTPKSIGEPIGHVIFKSSSAITVEKGADFHNGDGACFFDSNNNLIGFRVNRVEGNRIFPHVFPKQIAVGTFLFRNYDHTFQTNLQQKNERRRIPVDIALRLGSVISLSMEVKGMPIAVSADFENSFDKSQTPQTDNIKRQLQRLGETVYSVQSIVIDDAFNDLFIPSSVLTKMRRVCVNMMNSEITEYLKAMDRRLQREAMPSSLEAIRLEAVNNSYYSARAYLYNIYNKEAENFYHQQGLDVQSNSQADIDLLMQCRHCLKHYFGFCRNYPSDTSHTIDNRLWREPLYLRLENGVRFRLQFDCKHCQMNVFAT